MNYILIMTEGPVEKAFIQLLLERNLLIFKKEDLLMEQIFHSRQISGELVGYIQMIPPSDSVTIYRIGDKMSDKLRVPQSVIGSKIKDIFDVCTLPEFEILLILNDGLLDEYIKIKSKDKPSEFYKKHNKKFKKTQKFINDYFSKMTDVEIIKLLQLYVKKRGKNHNKNQKSILNIVRKNIM